MPTKDSTVISVRIRNNILARIESRLQRKKGMTLNRWLTWAILQGLRSHKKGVG